MPVDAENWSWGDPHRLWPEPADEFHAGFPDEVSLSLQEARKCFRAKAYAATTVMAGRAVEAICQEKISQVTLARGLRELKDKKVIDETIYAWGDTLRKERNFGAHATGVEISRQDAEDCLDFAEAIAHYIYVLGGKYKEFVSRQNTKEDP